jgi:TATA-box binding protein (TBP) (component of TFIID and TFIIIB)
MAKKSFLGGLDNLLASAGIKKKVDEESVDKAIEPKSISEDEKHWLLIKMQRLNEELSLWRSGKLDVNEFNESLKNFKLKYDRNTNEIIDE